MRPGMIVPQALRAANILKYSEQKTLLSRAARLNFVVGSVVFNR
jgi:hypothetical protein